MWKILTPAVFLIALQTEGVPGDGGQTAVRKHEPKRTFAAVLLVRGSVSGANVGSFGVFVRNENDSTWVKITRSNTFSFGLGYCEDGATRRYYLAAGNGLHRSTDGGKNWRILTSWRTEEILSVGPDPVDSAIIYVATPFGVFKTTDGGETWDRKMVGCRKWFIQSILMDCADRRILYAASEDDLYRSTDAGEHWIPLGVGAAPVLAVLQHPVQRTTLLAGIEDGGVRYSTDAGKSWQSSGGLEGFSIYAMRASSNGEEMYAGGWHTGLWRSGNGGRSWHQIWSDHTIEAIYSIFVDPEDSNHLMVGTAGSGLYESIDRGKTWKHAGLPGAQVKQIEVYP